MLKLACLTTFLLLATPAHAADADADQNLLLSPTPPAESVANTTDVSFRPDARKISLGLGTGVNSFGGNIGKLYSSSSPVVDLRGDWAFSRVLSARMGGDFAKYSFNAEPNGAVDVSTESIQAALECHYLSTALSGSGFDPYFSAGGGHVWRSQTFSDHNSVEKDNAFAASLGLGTSYLPNGGKLGFWIEADASQVFFADRYDQEYLPSGINDLTGLLYGARLGMKYVF